MAKKVKPPAPTRSKGETVVPSATLALVQKVGVTRASKEIGVSTTTLHKARKGGIVSKVVEIAAARALEHLGDHPGATPPAARLASIPAPPPQGDTILFLLEVSPDKAAMVEKFAQHLGAKLMAA